MRERAYKIEPQNIEQGIEPAIATAGKYRREKQKLHNSTFLVRYSIFVFNFLEPLSPYGFIYQPTLLEMIQNL